MTPNSLLDIVPVIPVVVVHDADDAVPIAQALVDGGLPVIELTLRTPAALEAIKRIANDVPDILVGAGTIVDTGSPNRRSPPAHSSWSRREARPHCGRPCATADYRTCRASRPSRK